MTTAARIEVLARPGSPRESIRWDPWRACWVVQVREPRRDGEANDAILRLLARALSVEGSRVRWFRAGRSVEKIAEVEGLTDTEVQRRLSIAAAPPPHGHRDPHSDR